MSLAKSGQRFLASPSASFSPATEKGVQGGDPKRMSTFPRNGSVSSDLMSDQTGAGWMSPSSIRAARIAATDASISRYRIVLVGITCWSPSPNPSIPLHTLTALREREATLSTPTDRPVTGERLVREMIVGLITDRALPLRERAVGWFKYPVMRPVVGTFRLRW